MNGGAPEMLGDAAGPPSNGLHIGVPPDAGDAVLGPIAKSFERLLLQRG